MPAFDVRSIQMDKPNVIVFFTDQQRWDTSGLHGNPLELMPNFDQMAMRGTHFFNAFTSQPVCGPARSCMQTGLYATQTGVVRNGIPLKDEAITLANCFNDAGYDTAYIGKWHLAGIEPAFAGGQKPVPKHRRGGYRYWLAGDLTEFISDSYHTVLFNEDNELVTLPGYRVDAQTDAAIRYIDRQQDNPFFMFLSFLEPHHQNHTDDYPPPDVYRGKYTGKWIPPDLATLRGATHQQIDGYYGMVKRLDEAFGRLLDALKSLGLLDKTIVLFTSDHGCHFKTRNWEYKRSCHESSIRIPMAAQGPGFQSGGRIQEMMSIVDVAPTLIDAAGLIVPSTMSGKSAMPLTRNQPVDWPDDIFIQVSESQTGRAVRTARWKYSVCSKGEESALKGSSEAYEEEFLYDLKADPYELNNLIGNANFREVGDFMMERLLERIKQIENEQPKITRAKTQNPLDWQQRRPEIGDT